jgi:hypothetical protein
MDNHQPRRAKNTVALRWMARGLSLVTSGVFLVIIGLALTNEDAPRAPAIPVLVLLGLTLVANFGAWRWERIGGLVVILLAGGLTVAAYSSSRAFGLGSPSFLLSLLYGGPFLVVGILFWISGQAAASGSSTPSW